ncbi:unnamed protein product [Haemonchus placei]|uniref:Uncharacterized protein n=1 Tax=Haemonchus placei TaxID=6290 RepID=A0A0N4WLR7_HAEPC|nr:unnamed protein product [Haemonchus placei]
MLPNITNISIHPSFTIVAATTTRRRGPAFLSFRAFMKKSDHLVGGRPGVRLTSRGIQSVTALVHYIALRVQPTKSSSSWRKQRHP